MTYVKYIVVLIVIVFCFSCHIEKPKTVLRTGVWRGEIIAQNNKIPFNFKILKRDSLFTIDLMNGGERLKMDKLNVFGDSIFFDMHIFDVTIRAQIKDTILTGVFCKNYIDGYKLPFKAVFNKKGRFDNVTSSSDFDGEWETTFTNKDNTTSKAIGIFNKDNNLLRGTFLSIFGDSRYLEGYTKKDTMFLYSFDGNKLYKYKAILRNDSLVQGEFWSSRKFYKTFVAKKNPNAKLPDVHKLTYLKEGYDKIEFSFPNLEGKQVSLEDEKYKNKVVILQLFGTWCPNCMDETNFLSNWYKNNKDRGVEIIGLAYEKKNDYAYAKKQILHMKTLLDVEYDYLIAGTSTSKSVSRSLPMLENIITLPTTIIIDKKGTVRRIHTGFYGPATGIFYEKFTDNFNMLIDRLLKE